MLRNALAAVALAASVVAVPAGVLVAQSQQQQTPAMTPGTYKVDPVHSWTTFRVSHLNLGAAWGQIQAPTGTIEQTADGVSRVEVSVDIDKVSTGNQKRDEHLKGPDFFNAKQFPQMTFKSTEVKKGSGEGSFDVTGDLTIKGVTKPVKVTLKKLGEGKGMQGEIRAGYETEFTINRLDYGITWNPQAVGAEVRIIVAVEATRQ